MNTNYFLETFLNIIAFKLNVIFFKFQTGVNFKSEFENRL